MLSIGSIVHLFAGLLLAAMATFALDEARSSSLIPKSLFLWPFFGLLFGAMSLLGSMRGALTPSAQLVLCTTGAVMLMCSLQALLVNIRKLSRWPSGAVWYGLIWVAVVSFVPYAGPNEPLFHTFFRRLSGFVWLAIGLTKVSGDRSVSQEGGVPAWILLLYAQAILIASSPA